MRPECMHNIVTVGRKVNNGSCWLADAEHFIERSTVEWRIVPVEYDQNESIDGRKIQTINTACDGRDAEQRYKGRGVYLAQSSFVVDEQQRAVRLGHGSKFIANVAMLGRKTCIAPLSANARGTASKRSIDARLNAAAGRGRQINRGRSSR